MTPATVYWTGQGDGISWSDRDNWADNWNNHVVPSAGDYAWLNMGSLVIGDLPNISVAGINCGRPIDFQGDVTIGNAGSNFTSSVTFEGQVTLSGTLYCMGMMTTSTFQQDVHLAGGAYLELDMAEYDFLGGVHVDGDGLVQVWGATLQADGAVSMRNLELLGQMSHLAGPGPVTITRLMTMRGGTLDGGGLLKINADAELDFVDQATKNLGAWRIENYGTVNWTSADLYGNGEYFLNEATFYIGMSAGSWSDAMGLFGNNGVVNSDGMAGAASHTLGIFVNSTNLVNVLAGTLSLTKGGELANSVTIAGGSTVSLTGGTFLFPSLTVQGDGFMLQWGASTIVQGTVNADNYELRGGTLEGSGNLLVWRSLVWSGGTMAGNGATTVESVASATISGATNKSLARRTLQNETIMAYTAGTLTFSDGATLSNLGIFDLRGDLNISNGGGAQAPSIVNEGELRKSQSGGGQSTVEVYVNDLGGDIRVQAGALIFVDVVDFFLGTFDISAGAEADVSYFNFNGGNITGAGTLSTLAAGGTINWYDGSATGTGTIQVTGGGSTLRIAGPMTLDGFTMMNEGTVLWQTGDIAASDATINNHPGAIFEASSDNQMTGTSVFYNYGTFRKVQGNLASMTKIGVNFNNKKLAGQAASIVNAAAGVISFQATGIHNSEFTAAVGGAIEFTGPASVQTAQEDTLFSGAGSIYLSLLATMNVEGGNVTSRGVFIFGQRIVIFPNPPVGGTMSGPGLFINVGTVRFDAGNLLNLSALQNSNVLEFRSAGVKSINNSLVNNTGTITWTAGNITMSNAATINNFVTFDVQTNATIINSGVGPGQGIVNYGTFKKTAGGETTIQVPYRQELQQQAPPPQFLLNGWNMRFTDNFFQNAGTAKMGDGTSGGGNLTIDGKYNLEAAATLYIDNGVLTVGDGLIVNGTVANGIGTINGDVTNAGYLVLGYLYIGSLVINGNYTQSSSGALEFEISGGGVFYDTLVVNGQFGAGGALLVMGWSGFDPPVGAQFELIEFWSRTGDFASQQLPTLGGGKTWKQQRWFDSSFTLEVE